MCLLVNALAHIWLFARVEKKHNLQDYDCVGRTNTNGQWNAGGFHASENTALVILQSTGVVCL
jgi:hypothetical protein